MQGRIIPSDSIECGDIVSNVAWPVPVPMANFVFFGVLVLLGAGNGAVLTEFIAIINAIGGRESPCQHHAEFKSRSTGLLENFRRISGVLGKNSGGKSLSYLFGLIRLNTRSFLVWSFAM